MDLGLLRLLPTLLIVDWADLRSNCRAWLLPAIVATNRVIRLWGGALETVGFGSWFVCGCCLYHSSLGGPWP